MKLFLLLPLLFFVVNVHADSTSKNVGFKTNTIRTNNHRKMEIAYWYPTNDENDKSIVFDNAIFHGVSVQKNAQLTGGKHPLILISHGFMGDYGNQSWLAKALASNGFIVASPNHPGTSNKDLNSTAKKELWRRPKDLSVIIDHVLSSPKLTGNVYDEHIYAIGHSLGAWSVTELAGAKFNHKKVLNFCDAVKSVIECDIYRGLTNGGLFYSNADNLSKLAQDLSDKRIKAIVSLDMGDTLQKGFTQTSLANISVPALFIDTEGDSTSLSNQMLNAERFHLKGAMHFSFLQRCKSKGFTILEDESKGDGILCLDGDNTNREVLHAKTVEIILNFLRKQSAPITP